MDSFILLVLRIAVGFVMLIAGLAKIHIGHTKFTQAILSYKLVSGVVALGIGRAIPALEIILGLSLIFGVLLPLVLGSSFLLLLGFAFVIAISLVRGGSQDCGCFGGMLSGQIRWQIVYRNLGMASVIWIHGYSLNKFGALAPNYAFLGIAIALTCIFLNLFHVGALRKNISVEK